MCTLKVKLKWYLTGWKKKIEKKRSELAQCPVARDCTWLKTTTNAIQTSHYTVNNQLLSSHSDSFFTTSINDVTNNFIPWNIHLNSEHIWLSSYESDMTLGWLVFNKMKFVRSLNELKTILRFFILFLSIGFKIRYC